VLQINTEYNINHQPECRPSMYDRCKKIVKKCEIIVIVATEDSRPMEPYLPHV